MLARIGVNLADKELKVALDNLDLPLERDVFLRALLRELSGTLQDVVGLEDASGYISVVGAAVGKSLDQQYRHALQVDRLSAQQVAEVLVDLKQRIKGDFYVIEETPDRIVFGSRSCPFGEYVRDRPALCMMTSNVFGYIAAENLGYARVQIDAAIARGDPGCRVTVFLTRAEGEGNAREYYRRLDLANQDTWTSSPS
ncbi:MAG TPA: methanogen output domain 1-containing protein [Acetobacteraceae bacterium]|nr:methanogen output domain 1-containing protein [Acetobacteraceae bacterium]